MTALSPAQARGAIRNLREIHQPARGLYHDDLILDVCDTLEKTLSESPKDAVKGTSEASPVAGGGSESAFDPGLIAEGILAESTPGGFESEIYVLAEAYLGERNQRIRLQGELADCVSGQRERRQHAEETAS